MQQAKGNEGYNALTGQFGDMTAMGILDPAKVVVTALRHASSVAGLILTTECMIAEAPAKEECDCGGAGCSCGCGHSHGGGDMDY